MQVSFKDKKATLFLVATPIGNLEDITFRAINTLKEVDTIFAEDTRTSGILLKHYNITTKLSSYHDHQRFDKISSVLDILSSNKDVALISDAGTPGISDPGYELVRAVIDSGYYVVSIPGAVASINALVSSGLVIQPHMFVGFLPRKKSEIRLELLKLEEIECTLIFYESPFRVKTTLQVLFDTYGNREVVVARELTKIYETFVRTTLSEAVNIEFPTKGEYIILVGGYIPGDDELPTIEELYAKYINEGSTEKEAMKEVALVLNISKKDVYQKIKIDN